MSWLPGYIRYYSGMTAAPGVTDDQNRGYMVSDTWFDETNDKAYTCLDATAGSAKWEQISVTGVDFGSTAITVDTINESTADAGVAIEGVLVEDGLVGIGADPKDYIEDLNHLVINGSIVLRDTGGLYFVDGTAIGNYQGWVAYDHPSDSIVLGAASGNRITATDGAIVLYEDTDIEGTLDVGKDASFDEDIIMIAGKTVDGRDVSADGLVLDTAVLETDFDATTFMYATSDDTPQPKTPAEVMAILSGAAAAAFSFNSQNLTSVGTIGCGAITTTGDFLGPDAVKIGSASAPTAINIGSSGIVTFVDDIIIKNGGTIGSLTTPGAMTISADGDVSINVASFDGMLNVKNRTAPHNVIGMFPTTGSGFWRIREHSGGSTRMSIFDTSGNEDIQLNPDGESYFVNSLRAGSFIVADGGTIGSVSDPDAIAISAGGDVTFSEDLIMVSGKLIGTAGNLDLITLADASVTVDGDLTIADLQDFTTYAETDGPGKVTVTSDTITFADVDRDEVFHVSKDLGAGAITNFTHDVNVLISAVTADAQSNVPIWAVAESAADLKVIDDAAVEDALFVRATYTAGPLYYLKLYNLDQGTLTSDTQAGNFAIGATAYLRINRTGTTSTVEIYSSAALRTAGARGDKDTLTLTCVNTAFRHVYGLASYNSGLTAKDISGTVSNLRLNNSTLTVAGYVRSKTATYRRYYHLPIAAFDPGASGATWTDPDANTLGGWQLDAAAELLFTKVDVHSDWDAASDLEVELTFECNINNGGGAGTDTVDIKMVIYYKGVGEISNKTQTVEVATVVGTCAQYTLFKAVFPIDYDVVDNVVQAGDAITLCFNLETDTSEVDNIIITDGSFNYDTTHIGIESGDT